MIRYRRAFRRERIFRDRTNPLEIYDDEKVLKRFRLPRVVIYELTNEVMEELQYTLPRKGCLSAVMQVCLALRYYASGSYQQIVGDLFGIDQATVSRTITRVTNAFVRKVGEWIFLPNQEEADRQKIKFFAMQGRISRCVYHYTFCYY